MAKMGGAAAKTNFYTYKALKLGYSMTTYGSKSVKAGIFVQINRNLPRLINGKKWSTLYSRSDATIIGRNWQNQAIGSGLLGITTGFSSLMYEFNYK